VLAEAIRERHGDVVAAVLFYGSCLRKATHEGVLDFYVIVDDYDGAFDRRWLAAANAVLPPNVFYLQTVAQLEDGEPPTDVRCKYAVLSGHHFRSLVSPRCLHPYVWARFAQPALLVYSRDDEARELVESCVARAVVTLVQRLGPFLPTRSFGGRVQRFSLSALWNQALSRTYGSEFRSESTDSVRALYDAAPSRYDECALEALEQLAAEGWIDKVSAYSGAAEVHQSPARRFWARLRWRLCWPIARTLGVMRLLKTAFTFGDWLPYVLWKIERHSGRHFEASERQRRHPFLFGLPLLFRVLSTRALR
jgi:hypothetical protein